MSNSSCVVLVPFQGHIVPQCEAGLDALERAGYGGQRLAGTPTGVFVGAGSQDYLAGSSAANPYWATSSSPAVLASRLSYFLDLKGPSLPVDTACSSGLVAVHLACQALASGECQVALAGAVHLNLWLENFKAFEQMGALSTAEGACRPFDERADGFVPSEGVVAVVLKPLQQALCDGDTIWGVIRGTATNNDGRSNGLTAPHPDAQRDVLLAAWHKAQIHPDQLSYIEAHGRANVFGPVPKQAGTSA